MEGKYGDIDVMSFCGDMGSARAKENEFWAYTKSVMNVVSDESIEGVYTTGNHEFYNGLFSETENAVRGIYKVGAVGAESSNYIIYCLGTDNWDDRKDNYPESQIESLTDFLNNTGNDKPIIILTHFPLHAFDSGRMVRHTANADLVIDVLNKAADSGKSKNSDGPKTGDSGYAFYLMLLIGSAAALAAMLAARALSFTRSRR